MTAGEPLVSESVQFLICYSPLDQLHNVRLVSESVQFLICYSHLKPAAQTAQRFRECAIPDLLLSQVLRYRTSVQFPRVCNS